MKCRLKERKQKQTWTESHWSNTIVILKLIKNNAVYLKALEMLFFFFSHFFRFTFILFDRSWCTHTHKKKNQPASWKLVTIFCLHSSLWRYRKVSDAITNEMQDEITVEYWINSSIGYNSTSISCYNSSLKKREKKIAYESSSVSIRLHRLVDWMVAFYLNAETSFQC